MTHSQVAKKLSEADSGMLEAAVKRVADFATQQDFRGQLTYHIKPGAVRATSNQARAGYLSHQA